MIKALYDIGKALSESPKYQAYFEPWENPFPDGEKAQDAKVIVIQITNNSIQGIELENFSKKRVNKYLFRSIRGANGTNLVPTFYFPLSRKADEEKWKKEQSNNINKLIKKITKSIKNQGHEFLEVSELNRLENLLLEKSHQLNKTNSYLLTMKVDGKYFGEFEQYRNLFEQEAYAKYHDKSSAKNKVCSLTYEIEEEVWGRIDTLGFTVNNNAFSRNGFSGKNSYKMLPVSPEAVKLLEGSKKLVLSELTRRFYNLQYFIIPHFTGISSDESKKKILSSFFRSTVDSSFEKTGDSIINNEKILHAITIREDLQDTVHYDILFYQQQQAQFLIKLQLNDVMPSRLRKVFDIKRRIEKYYRIIVKRIYTDPKTKQKEPRDFRITFASIKDFFSKKVKNDYVYHPYFFKILEAVFYGSLLSEQQIIKAFVSQIRFDFKQQNEDGKSNTYARRNKDTFVIYQYFLELGLFKNKLPMEGKEKQPLSLTSEDFIEQHSNFFDSEYKKGVFRLGSLSAYLMAKQWKKLNNTPFIKQLNSLNIDERTIVKIFPRLINKLREYNSALPDLEQEIAQALVQPNNLSKDEISYTFTLGLVMQREFSNAYKKKKKNSESSDEEE
ncbi:MAG: type I-B CRISPR-associated protein Cas8b/Csh1 [Saprospiraceae bacterium]|nr:MAG: type I-B CRISPR-associated protein Cas8b/Csh1 [Saprospiraceae bacterium]